MTYPTLGTGKSSSTVPFLGGYVSSLEGNPSSVHRSLLSTNKSHPFLVGGFNPSEKYARQIGSFPQIGVKK